MSWPSSFRSASSCALGFCRSFQQPRMPQSLQILSLGHFKGPFSRRIRLESSTYRSGFWFPLYNSLEGCAVLFIPVTVIDLYSFAVIPIIYCFFTCSTAGVMAVAILVVLVTLGICHGSMRVVAIRSNTQQVLDSSLHHF